MNDRFKFRVWDIEEWAYLKCKYSKSAGYHKYTFGKHDVWHDIGYFIENNPKYYIIEQCTGLKDKNGNLIYEGDILLLHNNKFEVGNNNITVFFKCLTDKYTHIDPMDFDYNESEIIGNIHEQTEQKE